MRGGAGVGFSFFFFFLVTANKHLEDAPEMQCEQTALALDLFGKGYDWLHPTAGGLGWFYSDIEW